MEEHMKEVLIRNMTDNLPTLRCKMWISQVRLAEMIGVCRCTVTSIENHKRPMTWNMFLSLLMIFTSNDDTLKLLVPMEIYTDELKDFVKAKDNERMLKCPLCKFPIIGILSDATGHLHFKCPKRKSSVAVNLSYFRRTRRIYRKQN